MFTMTLAFRVGRNPPRFTLHAWGKSRLGQGTIHPAVHAPKERKKGPASFARLYLQRMRVREGTAPLYQTHKWR